MGDSGRAAIRRREGKEGKGGEKGKKRGSIRSGTGTLVRKEDDKMGSTPHWSQNDIIKS